MKKWSRKWYLTLQDFTEIRNHFGEGTSLYFAFVQYYFVWLTIPAVLSLGIQLFDFKHSRIAYSIATSIWGLLFLEFWTRHERDLAMYWGSFNCLRTEKMRYQFKPDTTMKDPSGETILSYSPYKRFGKLLLTIPIVITAILALLGIVFTLFSVKLALEMYYTGPLKTYVDLMPTIAYVLLIPPLEAFYQRVAKILNDFEVSF